jgi:hypothetical protein
MTYSYRKGATITFVSEDGTFGPGKAVEYKSSAGWKVEVQDEGCVEVTQYIQGGAPAVVIPWHRIWQITPVS